MRLPNNGKMSRYDTGRTVNTGIGQIYTNRGLVKTPVIFKKIKKSDFFGLNRISE